MLRLMWLERKKIRKPVMAALLGTTVLSCILTCTLYRNYSICFVLDLWEIGTEYLSLLFPLVVTVPVCWQLYYERRDRFLAYTLARTSKVRYLIAKWLACAWSAFLILLIPYFLSALCALYATTPNLQPPNEKYFHVFDSIFRNAPLVYALLLSLWKSFRGSWL